MEIKIATAPVSWGAMLKDTPNVPPWNIVVDQVQQAGYTGTELGPYDFMPRDVSFLKEELAKRSLTLTSAYTIVNLVDPAARQAEYDEALETIPFLGAMGCRWLVLSDALFVDPNRAARAGRIRPEDGLKPDAWKRFVQNANDVARLARDEHGLTTVYHPHVGACVESPAEVDRLLSDTNPDLVYLCLDTAHSMYGGDDPVDLARRWGSRVKYLHLKECSKPILEEVRKREGDYFAGVKAGVFPELGQGSVDFPALLDVLRGLDYRGWAVVEQDVFPDDPASDPLASAKRNRDYLRRIGIG
jgi:inosose dehydratase